MVTRKRFLSLMMISITLALLFVASFALLSQQQVDVLASQTTSAEADIGLSSGQVLRSDTQVTQVRFQSVFLEATKCSTCGGYLIDSRVDSCTSLALKCRR